MINNAVLTRQTLTLRAMTLNTKAMGELCDIVKKAVADDTPPSNYELEFEVQGNSETISTTSKDSFLNARLPIPPKVVRFSARSFETEKEITFRVSNINSILGPYTNI